jgi:hypothetical protein
MRRCFLRALWRHFYRRWLARNAPRSKQLLLDVIFGFAREAIIELARLTEYQHFMLLANQVQCQAHFSASGQGKAKDCSASGIRLVLELAAVGFGGRLSNREAEPYAIPFADRNASQRCWRFQPAVPVRGRDLNDLIIKPYRPYLQIISGLMYPGIYVTQQIEQAIAAPGFGAHFSRLRIKIELDFGAPLELTFIPRLGENFHPL